MEDTNTALLVWVVIAATMAVTEAVTTAFVALYVAMGAIAAAIVASLDGGLEWQLLAFVVTGIGLMLLTRPLLKSKLESPDIHTNVHQLVGRRGIVTIPIDNDASTGQIRVGTEYWTARLDGGGDDEVVPVAARVQILAIEGVTARVVPVGRVPASASPESAAPAE